ncbi:uncharacterized protein LOC125040532 [Penaeus chinensis]|uniref:uncharacterized protein LOC125040532 n=1 Tax=Penaeus chinensis TaxID=139456 RepID=UPI001FB60B24|nr:uncharacterized protein LOC125040532 [Penaeus chinensis]
MDNGCKKRLNEVPVFKLPLEHGLSEAQPPRKSSMTKWLRTFSESTSSRQSPRTQGYTDDEKEEFWEELDEEVRKVPAEEKLWVGGDFNGHVGSDNTGREETVGRYVYGDKNDGGEELVAFAIRHNLWIVNRFYKKAPRHKMTYQSGGFQLQIDYILCRTNDKNTKDCKVILGESITNQHRPVICTLRAAEYKAQKKQGMPKTKWWKVEEEKSKREAKRAVVVAKARAYERLYEDLDTAEGMKKVLRMAKQKDKNSKDIYQRKLMKSEEGNVLTKNEEILER